METQAAKYLEAELSTIGFGEAGNFLIISKIVP